MEDYLRRREEFWLEYRELGAILYWEFPDFLRDYARLERRRPRDPSRARTAHTTGRPEVREVGVPVIGGGEATLGPLNTNRAHLRPTAPPGARPARAGGKEA